MKETIRKKVEDLGVAAFLKMHGFKIAGRKGKDFYFDIKWEEEKEFHSHQIEYANSPFHAFDHEIMALKKLPHYTPDE